jgi:XTP/dITP diphosphohydrolase
MRYFTDKKLVIATHNHGKLEEIKALLKHSDIEIISSKELNLIEPEETETTFIGNAKIKAHSACQISGIPSLSDDSGLEVESLGFKPGVYSADWAETDTGRDFQLAMCKVWQHLQTKRPSHPYLARMKCTMVLAWPDGHDEIFEGTVKGKIVWPMRGTNGHGYDPIFQPNGYENTFGEMNRWFKNEISHRAIALRKMLKTCFAQ